ncbi:hypothetical protein ALC56_06737 [Trachymyrmex septentrionalis]|uniref:Uncharacterized protein n=1 Tax=Trachymyrmex septentrionalis TaxID=34720 RepID=A0A195FEA8_9HYME|nr:hypothetical protein ALC56_06737 [Trachymyrmex septentrionalis]
MTLMNKLLSNSIEDQLERSFRTCLGMTGVHSIFLIRDYTSSSESASASKCTRWAFRDVSNPSGTPLQSDNVMVVVGTRHNNLTEQLILPLFFPFFLPKQRGRRGREGRRSESFLTEERIEFRFGSPAVVRLLRHLYRTGGTFNELSLSKRNEDEAREIFRTGVDYRLGGSFSELRAVTTNRMLETKEVQAAAVCFGVVSYFTLNINITTTRCTYYASTVYYEKYISQILKTGAEELARHSSDKIVKCKRERVYVNVNRTNDNWDRCFSETDPTIEQVYNGFCRGGNDCNHHSSLGKWKFGSPTLPLFNTVDSNDCPWTEEVDERGKIGGPAKRLKEIKREEELRENVLRDRVNEGKKYLLNYYRLLAEMRRSKCHGDRMEKSVVREDIVTVGACDLRCVMRRCLMCVHSCWLLRGRTYIICAYIYMCVSVIHIYMYILLVHSHILYDTTSCVYSLILSGRSAMQRQRVGGVVREVQQGLEENAQRVQLGCARTIQVQVVQFQCNRGSDNVVDNGGPYGALSKDATRAYSVKNVNKQRGSAADGAQIPPGFSAFLRACRSHRKVLKSAGNKCKDNEGLVPEPRGLGPKIRPRFLAVRERPEKQYGILAHPRDARDGISRCRCTKVKSVAATMHQRRVYDSRFRRVTDCIIVARSPERKVSPYKHAYLLLRSRTVKCDDTALLHSEYGDRTLGIFIKEI